MGTSVLMHPKMNFLSSAHHFHLMNVNVMHRALKILPLTLSYQASPYLAPQISNLVPPWSLSTTTLVQCSLYLTSITEKAFQTATF